MDTDINNFAGTLQKVLLEKDILTLFFHKGYYVDINAVDPIINITLKINNEPQHIYSKLKSFIGEEIDGLELAERSDENILSILFCWANDGQPLTIVTDEITVKYSDYTVDDYKKAISNLEDSYRNERQEHHTTKNIIESLNKFINDEMDRIEKKLNFFAARSDTRKQSLENELFLLKKIRNNIKNR